MANATFFGKTPFGQLIHEESLQLFQQHLEQKKGHLLAAEHAYQKALQLLNGLEQHISKATSRLLSIENALATAKSKEMRALELEKEKYQQFIAKTNHTLAPYRQRLKQLGNDIQRLKIEINTIIDGNSHPLSSAIAPA